MSKCPPSSTLIASKALILTAKPVVVADSPECLMAAICKGKGVRALQQAGTVCTVYNMSDAAGQLQRRVRGRLTTGKA